MKKIGWICLFLLSLYGLGRAYYVLTDGFSEANIFGNLQNDPRWEGISVSEKAKKELEKALTQPFFYLGKGCQSYVFSSQDGRYVIKFPKQQHFRSSFWLEYIPGTKKYREQKTLKKQKKLEAVFIGWRVAVEVLPEETGVLFVHLNKTNHNLPNLLIFDNLGIAHNLPLDRLEFLVQKKATPLCSYLTKLMQEGRQETSKLLLLALIQMIHSEYQRGIADNDHTLMLNTGVLEEEGIPRPVHMDVGQFVLNPKIKDPSSYTQEFFNKMYDFRLWLQEHDPSLKEYIDKELKKILPELDTLKPTIPKGNVGSIPHLWKDDFEASMQPSHGP